MVDDLDADDPGAPTTDDPQTTPEEGGPDGTTTSDDSGAPALADDEKAEMPPSLAEQMAEARDDHPESDDGEADTTADEGASEGGSGEGSEGGTTTDEGGSDSTDADSSGYTYGDVYVDSLAIFLIEVSAELSDDDPEMTEEDVHDLATGGPIDLSEAAADVFDDSGLGNDMTPGQALVTGSALVAFSVLIRETDAAGELVGRVSDGVDSADLGGAA
ncbi:hypothetical protein BRC97_07010 [Halobacteriales archaeon QS_6_71_20]|nr:MAG: hypothetical protein BRC97_07010 [Halobacteriales archaeon QS_6_71_20]